MLGDSSHLFPRKVGLKPKKQHDILSTSSETECYPIFENYLSRYLSHWKDERDESTELFSKLIFGLWIDPN